MKLSVTSLFLCLALFIPRAHAIDLTLVCKGTTSTSFADATTGNEGQPLSSSAEKTLFFSGKNFVRADKKYYVECDWSDSQIRCNESFKEYAVALVLNRITGQLVMREVLKPENAHIHAIFRTQARCEKSEKKF